MFGDIGDGETDENGKCVVVLDDVFRETIIQPANYQVFLQKCGKGDLWVSEKTESYFVVEGTEKLRFSWEIKAKQRNYESNRLEMEEGEVVTWTEIDYEQEGYGEKSRFAAVCVWKDLCNRKYKTKLDPSNSNFLSSCKKAAKKVVIKKGASGTFVYLVEFILSAKGYYTGAMDASFGSGLQAAVKAFQKAVGLKADGVVGAETWYKLFN